MNGLSTEIFEEPERAARYAIGADAAEGVGRDRGALRVLRVGWATPTYEVATGVGDVGPSALADETARLAAYYNDALVLPEANGPGRRMIECLLAANVRVMRRPGEEDADPRDPTRLGYLTLLRSRDVLLDTTRRGLLDGALVVRSARTIAALGVFVWGARRPEAAPGFFDDEVFALALAYFAALDVPPPPAPPPTLRPRTPAEHLARLARAARKR